MGSDIPTRLMMSFCAYPSASVSPCELLYRWKFYVSDDVPTELSIPSLSSAALRTSYPTFLIGYEIGIF